MPALRGLQRAQLWSTPSYVCHSCRHKLLLSRSQFSRSQANLSPIESGGDDWASNFNNLSIDEDRPSKSAPKRSQFTGRQGGNNGNKQVQSNTVLDGERGANGSSIGGRGSRSLPRDIATTKSFASLKDALTARRDCATKAKGFQHRQGSQTTAFDSPSQRHRKSSPSRKRKEMDRLKAFLAGGRARGRSAQDMETAQPAKPVASESNHVQSQTILMKPSSAQSPREDRSVEARTLGGQDGSKRTERHVTKRMNETSRNQFEATLGGLSKTINDMLAALWNNQNETTVDPTSNINLKPEMKPDAIVLPRQVATPTFDFSSPAGTLSSRALSEVNADTAFQREIASQKPLLRPSFTTTSTSKSAFLSCVTSPQSEKPLSLAQRLDESRDRPKWGGVAVSPVDVSSDTRLTFTDSNVLAKPKSRDRNTIFPGREHRYSKAEATIKTEQRNAEVSSPLYNQSTSDIAVPSRNEDGNTSFLDALSKSSNSATAGSAQAHVVNTTIGDLKTKLSEAVYGKKATERVDMRENIPPVVADSPAELAEVPFHPAGALRNQRTGLEGHVFDAKEQVPPIPASWIESSLVPFPESVQKLAAGEFTPYSDSRHWRIYPTTNSSDSYLMSGITGNQEAERKPEKKEAEQKREEKEAETWDRYDQVQAHHLALAKNKAPGEDITAGAIARPKSRRSERMTRLKKSLTAELGDGSKLRRTRKMSDESLNMLVSSSEHATVVSDPHEEVGKEVGEGVEKLPGIATEQQNHKRTDSDQIPGDAPSLFTTQIPPIPDFRQSAVHHTEDQSVDWTDMPLESKLSHTMDADQAVATANADAPTQEEPANTRVTSERLSARSGIAAAAEIYSSDGDQSSGTGGANGDSGDDSEHKSLWEVMSRAGALKGNVQDVASQAAAPDNVERSTTDDPPLELSSSEPVDVLTIKPSTLVVKPLNIPQPAVPGLEYGLDRVLFNPGIYQLQDPLSRVYNFDPYLQKIMPVVEFDFNALKEYKTSSQDNMLSSLAKEHGKRYIGSTSSMTGMLGHFHYLLSDWRSLNLNMFSRGFTDKMDTFTLINRAPNAIFLRWKNGTYAIDADKQYDSGNVLMLLGKSMEKLLTMPTSEYERYRKSDPRTVSDEERTAPEAFEYTTMGDFLMRSQLDAYDPRLPGTGMFDLKTRAVVSVRMNADDFQPMTGYEIHALQGRFGSYEREYYDMIRSTMLKYMLQARMGRMDGIFIAYHNVERIFGFQYLPIQEMDRAIHGQVDRCLGDQEFKTSLELMNKVFDKATAKFPQQSLRFHFETTTESIGTGNPTTVMWIFGEPLSDQQIETIQSTSKAKVAEFEKTMMGVEKDVVLTEASGKEAVDSQAGSASEAAGALTANDSQMPSPHTSGELAANAPEVITSNSGADTEFIDSIASSYAFERKPLFAASLICKSRVNGVSVQRPENLKPVDSWEVEYLLREWNAPDAMWARYEQMKARRKELMERYRTDEESLEGNENGEMTSKQKRERAFTDFLKSMSKSGREFRSKIDLLEAGKDPVVIGQPSAASHRIVEEKIGDVDEYMAWLYGTQNTEGI